MVTGGTVDTMEILDTAVGSWATSAAKLPQRTLGLRAANIDGRVLIFGKLRERIEISQQDR